MHKTRESLDKQQEVLHIGSVMIINGWKIYTPEDDECVVEIDKNIVKENPNYLGYDEDHNGDWNDFFMCPKCKENNYITIEDTACKMCGEKIEWVG